MPPTSAVPTIPAWNAAGEVAVSYEYQLPGSSLTPAARSSAPTIAPAVSASRQRTLFDLEYFHSVTAPRTRSASTAIVSTSVRRSLAERISPYRRRKLSGMSTYGRAAEGVSPAITIFVRIGAPATRRSVRSNVNVRSMRPLVFFVS